MDLYQEFLDKYSYIINDERYQKQKEFIQHGHTSIYDHELNVAFHCYLYLKKKNIEDDELIEAALLHDYFLYDWHDRKKYPRKGLHGFTHPYQAAKNAKRDFNVSKRCQKIIVSHMFPLIPHRIPFCKAAWILTYFDKKISWAETFKK